MASFSTPVASTASPDFAGPRRRKDASIVGCPPFPSSPPFSSSSPSSSPSSSSSSLLQFPQPLTCASQLCEVDSVLVPMSQVGAPGPALLLAKLDAALGSSAVRHEGGGALASSFSEGLGTGAAASLTPSAHPLSSVGLTAKSAFLPPEESAKGGAKGLKRVVQAA